VDGLGGGHVILDGKSIPGKLTLLTHHSSSANAAREGAGRPRIFSAGKVVCEKILASEMHFSLLS
jgi:hypothetical protein